MERQLFPFPYKLRMQKDYIIRRLLRDASGRLPLASRSLLPPTRFELYLTEENPQDFAQVDALRDINSFILVAVSPPHPNPYRP